MKAIIFTFIFGLFSMALSAQLANIEKGCSPLEVQFSAPTQSSYFWDFKDGATSTLQNPKHIFTQAGEFIVELKSSQSGQVLATDTITVYDDPIIKIESDQRSGCSPLMVNFTSDITTHPDISVVEYLWSFGDGNGSSDANPSHTYTNSGVFTVSLKITTNLTECDKTEVFEDFISVQGVKGSFVTNKIFSCEVPGSFTINNTTTHAPGNTYEWNFGNGETSNEFDPGTIVYNKKGVFVIKLTVTNKEGCVTTVQRTVTVGNPVFDLEIPDTACVGVPFPLGNQTGATSFRWTFDPPANTSSSIARNPLIQYSSSGIKTIRLSAWYDRDCTSDTSFQIFIEDPSAEYDVMPLISCHDPVMFELKARENQHETYIWNTDTTDLSTYIYNHNCPKRDSFWTNYQDTFYYNLQVITKAGCTAEYESYFLHRKPDAHFVPDVTRGCAPLDVTFSDTSLSHVDIVKWTWLYGDGTSETLSTGDDRQHTYTEPGEYYVHLVIENKDGCVDTSYGVVIYVGENITPEFTIDQTEICLNDTIQIEITNQDPRIDAKHISTDGGRFSHCFMEDGTGHIFGHEPGIFDATFTIEYNGCYTDLNVSDLVTVKGAKADIDYMINCSNPYDVMLQSLGKNDHQVQWAIDTSASFEDSLVHTFEERGTYTIVLEATDPSSGCPSDFDTTEVHITDIKAELQVPEKVCDNRIYELGSLGSQDVNATCYRGYLWVLPNHRPRENTKDTIHHTFPVPGPQEVKLIVEDVNGCRDTAVTKTTVYSIEPNFAMDHSRTCLPRSVHFADSSHSDTTIVSWNWSFGATDSIVDHVFTGPVSGDNIQINLVVMDAIGCIDQFSRVLSIYQPETEISYSPDKNICVGETIDFHATDYTSEGHFLHFDWNFEAHGTSDQQSPSVTFDKTGMFKVLLNFEEDSSGCGSKDSLTINVVPVPTADFITSVDSLDPICHPAVIEFENTSTSEGPVIYYWGLGNDIESNEENVTHAFKKGRHTVDLIVESLYGCADTFQREFVLVGPEGGFEADRLNICKGEEITFNLVDTADVGAFTWDFGDGTTLENEDPVTHEFNSNVDSTKVTLILKSAEFACELSSSVVVNITRVNADFEKLDSLNYCAGLATFQNFSEGADQYFWDFDDGLTSREEHPTIRYDDLGTKKVTLRVTDSESGCSDDTTQVINLEDVLQFYDFPNIFSPNGDSHNDYFNVVVKEEYREFVEVHTFKIYNRWGELIYDNDNPDQGWDGMVRGQDAPVEIYAYYIEIEVKDCNLDNHKGNVTIIR